MPIVSLVPVDSSILSSYDKAGGTGGPRANLTALARLGRAGVAHPAMAAALKDLNDTVLAFGGDFRVTECHRDVAVQKAARAKYDAWVAAGKPKPGSSGYDSSTMKAAFVAQPGRSGHNAGRSIDIHLSALKFPGLPANQQLDKMWQICWLRGWEPIIKSADEGASEAWHFDFVGDLAGVKSRLGYEQWALCGAILVGHGDLSGYDAEIQALLSRAGYDIGPIDGKAGPKTRAALVQALALPEATVTTMLVSKDTSIYARLLALPAK
jgi:hypothetical protein